jgi:urea transporter
MTIVLVIIGAIIGASTYNFFGFVAGGILGYLLAAMLNLREQVAAKRCQAADGKPCRTPGSK